MDFKIAKKYETYKNWTLDYDRSGSIGYMNGHITVHCTPDWDGQDGMICVQVADWTVGDVLETVDIPYPKPFDQKFWFKSVKPFLDKYGKAIKPGNKSRITFEGFVKENTGGGCEAMTFRPSNMTGMNFIATDEAGIPKGHKVTIGIEGEKAGLVMAIEIDFETRTIKGLEIS